VKKTLVCKTCLVKPCCSSKDCKEDTLINEICLKDPEVMWISGSTDRSSSTMSFEYILIDKGKKFIEIITDEVDHEINKLSSVIKKDWLKKMIHKPDEDYNLRKVLNHYVVGNSKDEDDSFIYENKVCIDYGGTIILVNK